VSAGHPGYEANLTGFGVLRVVRLSVADPAPSTSPTPQAAAPSAAEAPSAASVQAPDAASGPPPDPAAAVGGPVVLFDGICNLCNASVKWLIKRDKKAKLRFAPLQSDFGRQSLRAHPGQLPDSVVLIDQGKVYTRSAAALRIAGHLGFPWSLLRVFGILPRGLRDAMYGWVAKNRYKWFGKQDACMVPTPALRARFVADVPRKAVEACA
jgi:predicted DCC family thiol-disulfide oxidoreductase YuxK